jgi:hypothetical protein
MALTGSRKLVKTMKFDYDVSTVSIHPGFERLVAGGSSDPWIRIHDYESGNQLGTHDLLQNVDLEN